MAPKLQAFVNGYTARARTPRDAGGAPLPGFAAARLPAFQRRRRRVQAGAPRGGTLAALHPHCLRHTFVSIHLAHGTADVYWLARQLAHRDIRMTTAVYAHWLKPEALERFDEILSADSQHEVVAA
jgi:integrase